MDEAASIRIILKSSKLSLINVLDLFNIFSCFKPSKMKGKKCTNGKSKKYNSKNFYEAIAKEIEKNDRVSLSISDDDNWIHLASGTYDQNIMWLDCCLTYDLFEEKKSSLLNAIDNIMRKYDGIAANICSLTDEYWQDNKDIDYYRIKGKSLEGIHTKKDPVFEDEIIVDTEYNPGHSHIINGIYFTSCWAMWFGDEFFKYIPKNVLINFRKSYETDEVENSIVRIMLYNDIWEYDKTSNRNIQWDFRKRVGIDEVCHFLIDNAKMQNTTNTSIELCTENLEYNGSRTITYYLDSEGKFTSKTLALVKRVHIFNTNGNVVKVVERQLN